MDRNSIQETSDVTLRAIEPEDLDILYRIENDVRIWNVGITNVPYSRFALHEYIANATGDIYTDRQVRLMICKGGDCVGIVDLVNFEPQHLRAEVGIVIRSEYRGKGYGRASLQQVMKYAHKVLHLHQLYALVSVDNNYSLQLFECLGFSHTAVLKDWLFDGDKYHDAVVMQKMV